MNKIGLLCVLAFVSCGAACQSSTVSDVSGAGFILETPNAWSRANVPKHDPDFAAQVVTNRGTCLKLPGCRK
jgi:hypothetical protein